VSRKNGEKNGEGRRRGGTKRKGKGRGEKKKWHGKLEASFAGIENTVFFSAEGVHPGLTPSDLPTLIQFPRFWSITISSFLPSILALISRLIGTSALVTAICSG